MLPAVPPEALRCLHALFRGGLGSSPSLDLFHHCEQVFIDIGIYDERTMTAAVARYLAMGTVIEELAPDIGGDPETHEWMLVIAASQPLVGGVGSLRFDADAFRRAMGL